MAVIQRIGGFFVWIRKERIVNPLDIVIRDELLNLNITKKQLVKKLGYSNTNKGIRRLNRFIETGECENKEFVGNLMESLRISLPVLKNATDSVKENILEKRERLERESFKPHIEVKFDSVPRPILILGLCSKLWKIKIQNYIKDLGYEEELEEVVRIYNEHYKKYNGVFPGGSAIIAGFRYYRYFDESILFDNEGGIIQIDKEYIPETQANVRIK